MKFPRATIAKHTRSSDRKGVASNPGWRQQNFFFPTFPSKNYDKNDNIDDDNDDVDDDNDNDDDKNDDDNDKDNDDNSNNNIQYFLGAN